jgi:hypothetical protein
MEGTGMTYEDAVSIRSQQLSGYPVNPFDAALALSVIQEGKKSYVLHRGRKPRQVLEALSDGPMERTRFFERITEGKFRSGPKTPYEAFERLQRAGFVRCEVRLSEEGLRALGLEGPSL